MELFLSKKRDILYHYRDQINHALIKKIEIERVSELNREAWRNVFDLFSKLPYRSDFPSLEVACDNSAITIGKNSDLDNLTYQNIKQLVELLIPWRKGPFNLFGLEIDAEWRSNLKWDRVSPYLNLAGKRVADVGCGNGYYMFRATALKPELIIGFDPSEKFYFQFNLFQQFIDDSRLDFKPFGIEELSLFPEFFEVIICMGVIYHRKDPHAALRLLHDGLMPGGTAVVESFALPGDSEDILYPKDRYQQLRNVYFVPTAKALEKMLSESGFKNVRTVSSVPTTILEQRKTKYMQFDSLQDFLDPADQTKTIEGYPAPVRVVVIGEKE
jgi:tRNA (mo5U34)-methyltransferase